MLTLLWSAGELVAKLGEPERTLTALSAWGTSDIAAIPSVPTLAAALDNAEFREYAIRALRSLGKDAAPAVPNLLALLEHNDKWLRSWVFSALEKIGVCDEAKRARVRPFLSCSDPDERAAAACAMAAMGEPADQILPMLIEMAADAHFYSSGGFLWPDEWHLYPAVTHERLIAGIASLGPAAVPELAAALKHHDPKVRRAAAEALGKIGPPAGATVPSLMALLDDDASWDAAAEALGRLGHEAQAAVPKLVEMLGEPGLPDDSSHYGPILRALGGIGADAHDAAPVVQRLANREEPELRQAAVLALARIDPTNRAVIPQLQRLFAECERKPATTQLAFCYYSSSERSPQQIAEVVWELGPRAERLVPDLQRLVSTTPLLDCEVRCYAAFALARFAEHRQEAQDYLEGVVKTGFPQSDGNINLAHSLLQRIKGVAPSDIWPIVIVIMAGP